MAENCIDPLSQIIPGQSPSDYEDGDDDFGDESSSDEEYGCRALAFDPNQLTNSEGLPVNGHDFLKLVQEERQKLPTISCAPPPKSKQKQEPLKSRILQPILQTSSSEIDDISIIESCEMNIIVDQAEMTSALPNNQPAIRLKQSNSIQAASSAQIDRYLDLAHRDEIIDNFKKLRNAIEERRPQQTNGVFVKRQPCEDAKDREEVESESEMIANRLLNRIRSFEEKPDLAAILEINQLEIHLTLERLADFFERTSRFLYSSFPADWVYGLLAALREPIEADICSTLRRLAKICISRRDNLLESRKESSKMGDDDKMLIEEEELKSSLLIICVVRHYFGQSDLK